VKERVSLMGVVVRIRKSNPRAFGFAQGRLGRGKRDKDGNPRGVEMSERVGQSPPQQIEIHYPAGVSARMNCRAFPRWVT
jgi:hypothetical protein